MMIIRNAQQSDLSVLSALSNECGADRWSEASFAAELEHNSIVMCCDVDSHTVAFSVVSISFEEAYLHLVAVDSAYRGCGIAKALLSQCENMAVERGAEKMILDVRTSNSAAVGLYENMGYQKLCIRKNFYSNPKDDAFTMIKEL